MAKRRVFGQVFQRGTIWYIRTRLAGIARVDRVGPDKRTAEDLLADMQSKVAREGALGVREVASATLSEVWAVIEPVRRARIAPRWFELHKRQVEIATEFFGDRPVKDLRPEDIEDFLAHLQGRGCGASTVVRYLASLSPVLDAAVQRGFASENVASKVKRPRVAVSEVPFLGEPEIRRLHEAAPADLRPVIAILGDTGLRRGELLDLEWRDVDLLRGAVVVRHSKTGRGREVPLTARAREAFALLHEGRSPIPLRGEDPVFAGFLTRKRRNKVRKGHEASSDRERAEGRLTIRFRRLAASLGMVGVSVHTLRALLRVPDGRRGSAAVLRRPGDGALDAHLRGALWEAHADGR